MWTVRRYMVESIFSSMEYFGYLRFQIWNIQPLKFLSSSNLQVANDVGRFGDH